MLADAVAKQLEKFESVLNLVDTCTAKQDSSIMDIQKEQKKRTREKGTWKQYTSRAHERKLERK